MLLRLMEPFRRTTRRPSVPGRAPTPRGTGQTSAAQAEVGTPSVRRDLSGVSLAGRDLRGADMRRVSLHRADLRAADLRGADLAESDFRGADLRGADLRGARVSWAWEEWPMDPEIADRTLYAFEDAIVDDATRWPEGFIGVHAARVVYGGPDSITIGAVTIPCVATDGAGSGALAVRRIHQKVQNRVFADLDGSPYGLWIPRETFLQARPDLIRGQTAMHLGEEWNITSVAGGHRALRLAPQSSGLRSPTFEVVGVTGARPTVVLQRGQDTALVPIQALFADNIDKWWWHMNITPIPG